MARRQSLPNELSAIGFAERVCQKKRGRLTANRRRVFEIIHGTNEPIGAYEVLAELARTQENAQPPTVYRALEFLLEMDLIHKVESLNAYVSCAEPGRQHTAQILICEVCGHADEICDGDLPAALGRLAEKSGFTVDHAVFEVHGTCSKCH